MELEIIQQELVLRSPFRIAHSVVTSVDMLWVHIARDGVVGHGEIHPIPYFGESTGSARTDCMRAFAEYRLELSTASSADNLFNVTREMLNRGLSRAAVSGLEMALLDTLAKLRSQPLHALLELPAPGLVRIATTVPIGVDPEAVLRGTRGSLLKLKVDSDTADGVLRFCAEHPELELILDVNGGWSLEQLVRHAGELMLPQIVVLEEPLDRLLARETELLKQLHGSHPIFLDESARYLGQMLVHEPYVSGFNVKLAKVGGIGEALRIARCFRGTRKLMLGCFIESSLAIAAAYQLSAAFDYVDLDGHTFLADDPYRGLSLVHGELSLHENSYGIGVSHA
ncbi:MAG: Mandelate racemase/muconate lactonizing enzyme C-terminal domain protein [Myxococcaceae bacterium]|nr:Mandelate racemase/muconate lactonizing enzyme C-terminal domain protein [Myxococcaceae bacterium]